jgi:hypothetical protein
MDAPSGEFSFTRLEKVVFVASFDVPRTLKAVGVGHNELRDVG